MNNTVIVIPARMDSKRFPGKPLVKIEDKEMLLHVWEKAVMSKVGEVIIACCDKEIRGLLEKNNIKYIMTPKALKSGTDRVYNALLKSKKKYDKIINLQGDIPNINPKYIIRLSKLLDDKRAQITTLVAPIKETKYINDRNIVKVALAKQKKQYKALFFSRLPIPYNAKRYYEHIGIYGFKKNALEKFILFKKSLLEDAENLEQLRALENDMSIQVGIVDKSPLSIDTKGDLKKFLKLVKNN